jgi:predicted nucleic acid-binding protein
MILVDTSVVIEWVRSGSQKLAGLFAAHDAAICGVTAPKSSTAPATRPTGSGF